MANIVTIDLTLDDMELLCDALSYYDSRYVCKAAKILQRRIEEVAEIDGLCDGEDPTDE